MILAPSATSVSLDVLVIDDDGKPVAGLDAAAFASAFPSLGYTQGATAAAVNFPTISDLLTVDAAWAAGGLFEKSGGRYRLDAPDGFVGAVGTAPHIIGEGDGFHLLHDPISVGALTSDQQDQLATAASGSAGDGLSGPSSVTLTFVDADSNPVPLVAFTLLSADKSSVIGPGRADSNGVATFGTTDDNYYVTTQATSTVLFADEPLTVSGTTAATITGSSNAPAGSADAGACTIYDTTRGTDDSIKDGVIYNVKIVGGPAGTQNGLEFSATSSGTSANNMSFTLGRGVQFVLKRGTWASWSDPILVPDAASAQLASLLSGTIVGKDSAAP